MQTKISVNFTEFFFTDEQTDTRVKQYNPSPSELGNKKDENFG